MYCWFAFIVSRFRVKPHLKLFLNVFKTLKLNFVKLFLWLCGTKNMREYGINVMWVGNPKLIEIYETLQENVCYSVGKIWIWMLQTPHAKNLKIFQKNITMKVLWFNNYAANSKILLLVCQSRKTIFIYLLHIYE